ncbi:MAG: hypothetical protein A2148_06640 [Chloroflexi bacterium RBG_16_68_14]|nr:MAG: hypothetical protein A2148_06640 [Chloroflexi bacterium RBG_16_68_14]
MIPTFYHDISTGTINEGTGQVELTMGIQGVNCFEFVAGSLWVKVTQQITVGTKQPLKEGDPVAKLTGTSYISLYTNSTCAEPWSLRLGPENNVESAALVPSRDTDGDGCSDYEELGDDAMKGGKRDPFNRHDFYDFSGNKYIDAPNDILQVMLRYTANPVLPYSAAADRGSTLGPSAWNRKGPDGRIDAPNDIIGVKFQYQHDCRAAP